MKRPGWLGGRRAEAKDDGDLEDEGDIERGNDEGSEPAGPGSAADRSARRIAARRQQPGYSQARRRLADRVGKAGGEADEATEAEGTRTEPDQPDDEQAKPEPGDEPGPDGKPPRGSAKAERRPDDSATAKRRSGSGLNRPRRQSGGGGGRRDQAERRRRRRGGTGSARRRAGAAAGGFAAALKHGAAETRRWAAANAPRAARALLAALAALFAVFFEVLGFVLNVLIAAWRVVARPVRAVLAALDGVARAVSRQLTPIRALALVVAGAAILLALSQYADYRSISIGNDAYSGVQSVAPAPETGRLPTGDAHSYVFVPVAIACLLLLGVAIAGRRWRLCRLITLAGAAAIVVALVVDRPAGLDPGDAAVSFEGVRATLIGGFYAQIAAGVLLIGSSSLLARELRLAGSTRRVPAPGRRRATKRALPGRAAGTGGARA